MRPTWSTEQVQGQPELNREILSQKTKSKMHADGIDIHVGKTLMHIKNKLTIKGKEKKPRLLSNLPAVASKDNFVSPLLP